VLSPAIATATAGAPASKARRDGILCIVFLQLEGIAKAVGVYKGRPPSIEASRVRELKAQGMRPSDIAKTLKIGRASVYRVLGQRADKEAAP
jgi:DNA invertase Pin-like site-specific DNA recombinase